MTGLYMVSCGLRMASTKASENNNMVIKWILEKNCWLPKIYMQCMQNPSARVKVMTLKMKVKVADND